MEFIKINLFVKLTMKVKTPEFTLLISLKKLLSDKAVLDRKGESFHDSFTFFC